MSQLKHKAKRATQNLLVRSGLLRAAETLVGLMRGYGVRILYGHRVLDNGTAEEGLTREQFAEFVEYLQRHYRVVSLDEACQQLRSGRTIREPLVVLTFDDGYADNYRNAWPVLRELGAPATVFVTTGLIGTRQRLWTHEVRDWLRQQPDGWDETAEEVVTRLKRMPTAEREAAMEELRQKLGVIPTEATEEERMLSVEELRELAADPLITIGAHTVHHTSLSCVQRQEAWTEIAQSADQLAHLIGQRPKLFAYPDGTSEAFGARHVQMLRELGFVGAVTATEGANFPGADPFRLRRIALGTCGRGQMTWNIGWSWLGCGTREYKGM